ncbi:MAG TPA: hypothetical protein VL418_06520 [Devosiaceae bacterium]|nr:hypothetical protein [Devosiaceae bacterium]
MQTIAGLFDDYADASSAVRELHAAGIANADISLVTSDQGAAEPAKPSKLATDVTNGAEGGAGAGVVLGGAGGLLASIGVLAVPGVGPVIAGGWLLATAAGAAAGAIFGGATGGIIGALVSGGLPESDAHVYSEGLRRGGSLVTVRVPDDKLDQARMILEDNDSVDIQERRAVLEGEGWHGFDESAPPLAPKQQMPRSSSVPPAI